MVLEAMRVAAGIGCRRGVPWESVAALVRQAIEQSGLRPHLLSAPDFKRDEPGVRLAAEQLGLTLLHVPDEALRARQQHCATRSERVRSAVGVASVAEACALAALGREARLVLARISRAGVTVALAVSDKEP